MAEQLTIYSRLWPRQFLSDFERTGEALLFYLFLLTRANPSTGYFRGSFRRVAAEIGVSVVEIRGWLERLEREGYLRDESLDGRMVVRVECGIIEKV
jgi:hypothetical protein